MSGAIAMNENLKELFIEKLKSGGIYTLRQCRSCGEDLKLNSDGELLFFDRGCACTGGRAKENNHRLPWSVLDDYLAPENGHISTIEAWVAKSEDAHTNLRPCPWCNAQPEVYPVPIDGRDDAIEITCTNMYCDINPSTGNCSYTEEAEKYWNTRAGEAINEKESA